MQKTIEQIKAEYDSKCQEVRNVKGMSQSLLTQLLSDAWTVQQTQLDTINKANGKAVQLTHNLTLSFPTLENCLKEDRKTGVEYDAVKGGTVNFSYKNGKGKQTSYTAYIPLDMYLGMVHSASQIDEEIEKRVESGHLFKISGITRVEDTQPRDAVRTQEVA
jgi:hypothetical protein